MRTSEHTAKIARVANALRFCVDPKNWVTLAGRVARNPEFFADLLEYAQADPTSRRQALSRIRAHLYRRALEGDLMEWRSSTKGFARRLLVENPWLEQQLGHTPHLGAIRNPGAKATRLDYTHLLNHQLLAIKETFSGYGLGSSAKPLPSGTRLSLLETTQAWSVLTNAGHLFGTFSTERGLLYALLSDRDRSAEEFLGGINSSLQDQARALTDTRSITHFFYALACWRISRAPMENAMRSDCIALIERFLDARLNRPSCVEIWAFRRARQLAYNRLHLYMSVGHPADAVHDDSATQAIFPWPGLGYEAHAVEDASPFSKMLDALDIYQGENYFASADVASDVLGHLRTFKHWWRAQDTDLATKVDQLFGGRPAGWKDVDREDLSLFARVHLLGGSQDWFSEVQQWLSIPEAWGGGNVVISPRGTDGPVADIYVRTTGAPDPRLLCRSAEQLAHHCVKSWGGGAGRAERELWRSIALFGARTLGLVIKPNRTPIVRPLALSGAENTNGHVGYAIASCPGAAGIQQARALVGTLNDIGRRREREAALEEAETTLQQYSSAPMIFFLGTVYLVESKRSQIELAEFDGAWCFLLQDRVVWYLLEHKARKGANSDLNRKLQHFSIPAVVAGPSSALVTGNVKVAKLEWTPASTTWAGIPRVHADIDAA